MNISRLNYSQILPIAKDILTKANFLSLDLEMSGIQTEQLTTVAITDSVLWLLSDASQVLENGQVLWEIYSSAIWSYCLQCGSQCGEVLYCFMKNTSLSF